MCWMSPPSGCISGIIDRLLQTLIRLRDMGNTLVVVEHDEATIRAADWIVDLGPGAGVHGGEIVAEGPLKNILAEPKSLTGRYLRGELMVPVPTQRRSPLPTPPPRRGREVQESPLPSRGEGGRRPGERPSAESVGAAQFNLKNIDIKIPWVVLWVSPAFRVPDRRSFTRSFIKHWHRSCIDPKIRQGSFDPSRVWKS